MSNPGFINNYDLRRALEIERMILSSFPRTVGFDHPAYQATTARVEVLRELYAKAMRIEPNEV